MKIMLDAGHGGKNKGCKIEHVDESDWTFDFVEILKTELEYAGFEIEKTRQHRGYKLTQFQRGLISSRDKADLVISIHVNDEAEGVKPTLSGLCFFAMPTNWSMQKLAESIGKHVPEVFQGNAKSFIEAFRNIDWLKPARSVLTAHAADTLLVECGFAKTNTKALLGLDERVKLAKAITKGLLDWRENNECG